MHGANYLLCTVAFVGWWAYIGCPKKLPHLDTAYWNLKIIWKCDQVMILCSIQVKALFGIIDLCWNMAAILTIEQIPIIVEIWLFSKSVATVHRHLCMHCHTHPRQQLDRWTNLEIWWTVLTGDWICDHHGVTMVGDGLIVVKRMWKLWSRSLAVP